MAAATRAYERGSRDQSAVMFRQVSDDGVVRLGKTAIQWNKGTTANINVWEGGTPPNETQSAGVTLANCVNKFANVSAGKWVILAPAGNGSWYLIAAEC
jgi:hypothetical protein